MATGAAFVWALAAVVGVVLTFADAAGMPLSEPSFGAQLMASAWSIDTLRVMVLSAMAAFVVATGAALATTRAATVALTVVALFGVLVLAPAGHAGGSSDHETAVNALGAHLVGVSLWLGGLLGLVVLRRSLGDSLGVVARRYSSLALWCFVIVGVSGVMSASTRLSGWRDLTTDYGVLVLAKVLAFVALGVAGWWHRRAMLERIDAGGRRAFARLAAGEAIVMGVAVGIATALARTAPPVPETESDPSAALALTGFPAPPAPIAMSWLTAWRVEWLFLAVALLAIGLYVAGVVRLRRRGDAWPVLRTVTWVIGWLLFVYATNGVLGIYGRVAFSWHMTLHMFEAMVVPIFLVLGAPVTLALRTLRPRRDGTLGPREMVLGLVHSRFMAVLGNPVFAAAFFFMSLVVFYWTGLFELALTTHTGHLLMTAHFMVTGYLFAWVLVGVDPGPKRWSPALRLIVLFATIAFHAFFGVAMITGTTVLGGDFFEVIDIPWVQDRLADQRFGGGVALGDRRAAGAACWPSSWRCSGSAATGPRRCEPTARPTVTVTPSSRHTTPGWPSSPTATTAPRPDLHALAHPFPSLPTVECSARETPGGPARLGGRCARPVEPCDSGAMKVALIQLAYGDDESVLERTRRAADLVRAQAGHDLVVLPSSGRRAVSTTATGTSAPSRSTGQSPVRSPRPRATRA